MKSKCVSCSHHNRTGMKHTCDKCPSKTIFGEIPGNMKFIECCGFYEPEEKEKERLKCLRDIKKLEDEKFILEEMASRKGTFKMQLIKDKEQQRRELIQKLKELNNK